MSEEVRSTLRRCDHCNQLQLHVRIYSGLKDPGTGKLLPAIEVTRCMLCDTAECPKDGCSRRSINPIQKQCPDCGTKWSAASG
jgi:hypothetical protein